jgi:hypothetical protein
MKKIASLIAGLALALGIALSANTAAARDSFGFAFSIGDHRVHPGYGGYFYVDQRHGHRAYSQFYYGGRPYRMDTRWVYVQQRWQEVYYLPPAVYAPAPVPVTVYGYPAYHRPAPVYMPPRPARACAWYTNPVSGEQFCR